MTHHDVFQLKPRRKSEQGRRLPDIENPSLNNGVSISEPFPSFVPIPEVICEKDKTIRMREKEAEMTHIDIDEHLMRLQDVVVRYNTKIEFERPQESRGLTKSQVDQLLLEHGPNVLTPQKKKNLLFKYMGYLSSLFNLLLILAGVLEYIILGIKFNPSSQNVSGFTRPYSS